MDKNINENFEEPAQIIYVEGGEPRSGHIVLPSINNANTYTTYEYIQFESNSERGETQFLENKCVNKEEKLKINNYICGSCDESFTKRTELDLHLKINHPDIYNIIRKYRKDDCKNTSETREHCTSDNDRILNASIDVKSSRFICKCGDMYSKFFELEQHVISYHIDELEVIAEETDELDYDIIEEEAEPFDENDNNSEPCDDGEVKTEPFISDGNTSFVTMDELLNKKVAGSKGSSIVRGGHTCLHCNTKFWLKKNFLSHMRENHPDKPEYMCDVCSKGFFDHLQLREHKRIHNVKQFVCDICSKGFATKSKLTIHLDVHFRRNTVDCEICGKTFAAKSGYRVHLKKHLGMWEKNLACSICDARFRYEYHLNIHMKSHSGEKNHFCDICNKGFALPRQLQAHMDGHNNVRRYKCDNCSQTFIRRQTWRRHLITHTGEKAYKCEICAAAYVDRRTLRRHLEKVHPGSDIQAFSKPIHAVPVVVDENMTISDLKNFI